VSEHEFGLIIARPGGELRHNTDGLRGRGYRRSSVSPRVFRRDIFGPLEHSAAALVRGFSDVLTESQAA
jgi:hypothetical protein